MSGEKLFGDFCKEYFKWRLLCEIEDVCRANGLDDEQTEQTCTAIAAGLTTPYSLDLVIASWGERLYPIVKETMEAEMDESLRLNRDFVRKKIEELWS